MSSSYLHHHHTATLFFFFLVLLLFSTTPALSAGASLCKPEQRSLLIDLRKGFSFTDEGREELMGLELSPRGNELLSWEPDTDCCSSWEGVTCDLKSGLVVGLDLSEYGISGEIHSSLFNLTSLQTLNLAFNCFNFIPIPPGIKMLTNLTHLNLSMSEFSGQISEGISRLKNLVSLDLSSNGFELKNPNFEAMLRNLGNLRKLYLDGSEISADGYAWCSLLPKWAPQLQALSLRSCSLTGPLHSSLSKLHNLSVLHLDENALDCSVPSFFTSFSSLSVVSLYYSGLRGPIPTEMFLLQNLTEIYLSDNPGISGHLPDFAYGSKLEYLDLSGCQFSGAIPSSIGNMTQLQYLDLSWNELSGSISPLFENAKFTNTIYVILLGSNNFNGTLKIDWILKQMKNLESLDLSNNQLNIIVEEDGDCALSFPKIVSLGLASCNLTRIPKFLSSTKKLEFLDLSHNTIGGTIPAWVWNLVYLNLSHNLFTTVEYPLPSYNLTVVPIRVLDLSSNILRGPIPLLPALVVNYSHNSFSSFIPSNISSYLHYTYLFSVANNNLTGQIPQSFCNVIQLQILDLSGNKFNGSIPSCLLGAGYALSVLNLDRNQLEGTIPHNISRNCGLRILKLSWNHFEGQLPRTLAHCHYLEILDIGNNHINGSFPFWLGKIRTLRVFSVKSNHLYGTIALQRGNQSNLSFPMLQVFDVSSNNFNGSLPIDFFMNLKTMMMDTKNRSSIAYDNAGSVYYDGSVTVTNKDQEMTLVHNLRIFTAMDFSDNDFEGYIPEVIGKLLSLDVLNLSHNSLTGKIPSSIGNLKQIESLDLSGNHLSGEIPPALRNLTFLAVLKLSDNDLVGEIPQGNQFSTFPNSSYEGNEGLCGPPLSKQCHRTTPTDASVVSHPSSSKSHPSTFVIGLALFIGIGFGVGLAIVLVLQNTKVKFPRRQNANQF